MPLTRRQLLTAGVTGLAGATAIGASAFQGRGAKRAKNIIFCVVDGMAMQTMTMTDHFQQLVLGRPSYWATLLEQPYVCNGLQDTRSLSSVVTDSSAASSTWGAGRRIWNGQVNEFPDGTRLRPISSIMSEHGVRCGLVTTTTITHATPAGFAINCVERGLEGLIAERYMGSGVDILMGGGDKFFSPTLREDKKDVYAEFARKGFKVVKSRDEVLGLKAQKILGIFSESHVPFTIDRDNSPELQKRVPTLAEMATVAIENLKGSRNGFLLQIEGGKVDHAAHGNDLAGMIYDQIAFEEAMKVAVDFALKDGETLVIITSDHACGGPSLNGAGHEYFDSTKGLQTVAGMKASYSPILEAIGKDPSVAMVKDVIEKQLSIKLSQDEAVAIQSAINGTAPLKLASFHASVNGTLAMALGNHTKVNWTSGNHSNDHVLVTALGPGKEAVLGLTPNVEFFNVMLAAKGLKWSNPTMSYADAARHYEKLKEKKDAKLEALYGSREECFE